MKGKDKQRLYTDLIRISDQIGILPNERPRLITDRQEMHDIKLNHPRAFRTDSKLADKRTPGYGECIYRLRTVFVDTARHKYQERKFMGRKGSRYQMFRTRRARYSHFLHTLVHELVHYRWPYFREGRTQEKRVVEVLRGKIFEPKHVHLFSGHPKSYRALIDGRKEGH
jgi:hypothetical protein